MTHVDDAALLAVVYRGRPATVDEVVRLTHVSPEDARAAINRLSAAGLVSEQDGRLSCPDPADCVSRAVAAHAAGLRRSALDSLQEIERLVEALPAMMRQWSVGESSSDVVPVVVRSGPHASEDLWYDTASHDSGTVEGVLPQVDRFLTTGKDRRARFAAAFTAKDAIRIIIPSSAAEDPRVLERLNTFRGMGMEFRAMDHPPSWFWVDGDRLAMPFEWGEGSPTTVLGLRSGPVAGLARALFAELWRRSDPLVEVDQPWTPLLRLMRQGITLDTASRMLGINPRTGRRRVAAAMTHYGASTLFGLGVAWSAHADE
jgi:hypothetical protein